MQLRVWGLQLLTNRSHRIYLAIFRKPPLAVIFHFFLIAISKLMRFDKGLDNTSKTISRVVAFLNGHTQPLLLVCFSQGFFPRFANSTGVLGGCGRQAG